MSAAIDAGAVQRPQNPALAGAKVTFARVLRSEWRKLFSLRATWIMFGVGVLLTLVIPLLGALAMSSFVANIGGDGVSGSGGDVSPLAAQFAVAGLPFGALLVAVAFTVNMAGEYNTHTIVSTLGAVPSRTPVYLAKALLAVVIAFVAGVVLHLVSSLLVALPFRAQGLTVSLPDDLWRELAVSGLHVAVVTMIGLSLGALIRNTAGAIVSLVALVLVLSSVFAALAMMMPDSGVFTWFSTHLPVEAAEALRATNQAAVEAAQQTGYTLSELSTADAAVTSAVWLLAPFVGGWISFKIRPVK